MAEAGGIGVRGACWAPRISKWGSGREQERWAAWGWGCPHATGEAASAAQPTAQPSPAPAVRSAPPVGSTAAVCADPGCLPGMGSNEQHAGRQCPSSVPAPLLRAPQAWEPTLEPRVSVDPQPPLYPFSSLHLPCAFLHLYVSESVPLSIQPDVCVSFAQTAADSKPDSVPGHCPERHAQGPELRPHFPAPLLTCWIPSCAALWPSSLL